MPHSAINPADAEAIRQPVRRFVEDYIIPLEQEAFGAGLDDKLRIHLQQLAHDAGLLAPQAPAEYGGGGADFVTSAVLLEEAGYSPLGPLAMNCAAPDEGNMHLLAVVGTEEQKERYLRPLVRGDMRSCFAMTEPAPGAGSDPAALTSVARKVAGGWLLDGDKHFITGAEGAGFAIVMARSQGPGAPGGASMFLIDADNPGWQVGNRMRTIDAGTVGGHSRVQLREAFVGDDAVLGEPGRGFAHAQVRLVPARLTHCMRWLGAARRAHDVALRRASGRELFGAPLGSLGMAQQLIADNEIELVACRALLWQVAAQVMGGLNGTEESSRAKVFISEATCRIVDRAVQLAGGAGVTEESVIGRIYADIRAFRIYDGPSEAHRAAIARRAVARIKRASTSTVDRAGAPVGAEGPRGALITGATGGIGRAIAGRLAHAGYRLTLSGRDEAALGKLASDLAGRGAGTQVVPADMGREEDIRALARTHADRFGPLDLLVLSAGTGTSGRIAEYPMRRFDRQMTVNVRAPFALVQGCLPALRRTAAARPAHGARIVAIASMTGIASEPGLAAYGATKAALISLCQSVNAEESSTGVTATAIAPGYVDTEMSAWVHNRIHPAEMLPPADIAELVHALAQLSARSVVPLITMSRPGASQWRA